MTHIGEDGSVYRKPDEGEQGLIVLLYERIRDARARGGRVVAVAMGRNVIGDHRGRWSSVFGLPVIEVRHDDDALCLLIDVRSGEPAFLDPGRVGP